MNKFGLGWAVWQVMIAWLLLRPGFAIGTDARELALASLPASASFAQIIQALSPY